jgi:beta-lactamase regulating signal transducer with metallopeptidase domain
VSALPLVPLLAVVAVAFLQIPRWRVMAAAVNAAVGLLVTLAALSVRRTPVHDEAGSAVALGAGMLGVAVAAGVAVQQQRSRA